MRKRKSILLPISIIMLVSMACTLSTTPTAVAPDQGNPNPDSQQAVDQAVQQTLAAKTQMEMAIQLTMAAAPSDTPEFTFTPSDTPTETPTFTPEKTTVTVSVATNCRSGPGTVYDLLGALQVGETADVIGKNQSEDTWIVQLPGNPPVTCWLWGQYATVTGNTANLPIMQPPPTPTPEPGYTLDYVGLVPCLGFYAVEFQINNIGSLTWESIYNSVTDTTTSYTVTRSENSFKNYNSCTLQQEDQNLEPGESGNAVSAVFPYSLSGHHMTATVKVCSLDNLAGTCLEKTINFTP